MPAFFTVLTRFPFRSTILLFFLFTVAFHNPAHAEDFKLVKQERHIYLYEREVVVQQKKVREVKAEFIIQTDPLKIIGLLRDEKQFKKWNKHVDDFKVIAGSHPLTWITYTRFDLPFPFSDQEMLLQYQVGEKQPDQSCLIQFASITSSRFPVKKEGARIHHVKGSWLLERHTATSYKITYRIQSERKTEIPKYISDPIVRDNLIASVDGMKTILEQ